MKIYKPTIKDDPNFEDYPDTRDDGELSNNKVLTTDATGNVKLKTLPASTGDKNFYFTQGTPSNTWTIQHNLNKYPSVTVIDSGNSTVEGTITHTDTNNLVITFNSSFSGTATLN